MYFDLNYTLKKRIYGITSRHFYSDGHSQEQCKISNLISWNVSSKHHKYNNIAESIGLREEGERETQIKTNEWYFSAQSVSILCCPHKIAIHIQ